MLNEPIAALHRDNFAAVNAKVDEAQICSLAEHQLNSLENLVLQQRRAQIRIARVLKEAELRHRKVRHNIYHLCQISFVMFTGSTQAIHHV